MKTLIALTVAVLALASVTSADAKGCLKGAAVGGVAGHFAGHHGLLGAAAGCLYGRHHAKEQAKQQQQAGARHRAERTDQDVRALCWAGASFAGRGPSEATSGSLNYRASRDRRTPTSLFKQPNRSATVIASQRVSRTRARRRAQERSRRDDRLRKQSI